MNILLSIKSEYTERIFSGGKKYEFRKQKPKKTINRVLIYECAPLKNIVGWFSVRRIISGSPKEIWEKCKDSSGIAKEDYFAYCKGKKVIYAFEIHETFQFHHPIDPHEIAFDFSPPQNFTYLDSLIDKTLENKEGVHRCLDLG
jgi:predicted transcriptional regulator